MIIIIFYQAAERGLSIFEQCLSQNSLLYLARSCMTRIIMTSGDWATNVFVRKRTRHETSDFYHKTCQQEIYCKSDVLQKSQKPKTPMTFRFVNVWLKCNQILAVGKPLQKGMDALEGWLSLLSIQSLYTAISIPCCCTLLCSVMCSTRDCTSWSKQVLCITYCVLQARERPSERVWEETGNALLLCITNCLLRIVYVLCIAN